MVVFGIPLSFFLPLMVHVWAGLATVIIGIVAFRAPKRRGRHPRWGTRYLWAYTLVFLTATILSAEHWGTSAYLFFIALVGYGLALSGYVARRFRREPWLLRSLGENWVIAHIAGTIGSYIVLLTILATASSAPAWEVFPFLFVLTLFTAAVVSINIAFSRRVW